MQKSRRHTSATAPRVIRPVTAFALAFALVVTTPGVAQAANPPITTAVRTLIHRVDDVAITDGTQTRSASAMNGMVIVGATDAYLMKSDHSGSAATGWASFIHINDFNTAGPTIGEHTVRMRGSSVPYSLGHANGMAYYNTPGADGLTVGSFYVPMIKALGENQVAQINYQGEVTALFKARSGSQNKQIASIAYRGSGVWIVGTAGENIADPADANNILKPYYLATIVGDTFVLGNKFFVPTTKVFDVGQDIYYDSSADQLLVPVWDGKTTATTPTGRKNRIIVVALGTVTNGAVYTPVRWIDLTVSAADASKFEIEGIARDSAGTLFVNSNIVDTSGETGLDAIHKITGS